MHCTFEPTVQFDCIRSAIEIARESNFGQGQAAEAVQHLSCFSGCLGAMVGGAVVVPNPDLDPPIFASTGDTLACICDDLEKCIDDCCPDCPTPKSFGASDGLAAVNWAMVFQVLSPLVMQLLEKLFDRFRKDS